VNAGRVLIIGYGNVLRGDDAVGPYVVETLREDPRLAGARIISCPQLTPELAEDVGSADLVVLIDARVDDGAPGTVRVDPIAAGERSRSSVSHLVHAGELVDLARAVFGASPAVMAVSVGAVRFGFGEELSSEVLAAVPFVMDAVVRLARCPSTVAPVG